VRPSSPANPVGELAERRCRIVEAQNFAAVARPPERKKFAKGRQPAGAARRERQLGRRAAEAGKELVDVAEPPAATDTKAVRQHRCRALAQREGDEQRRKIHAGIDRKLERPPEPAVDLHQVRRPGRGIEFVLDHRHAAPAEPLQQGARAGDEVGIGLNALAIDAYPAGGRLLAYAPVCERGNHLTIPEQQEDTDAGPDHPLLQEKRIGVRGEGLECACEGGGILRVSHRVLGARSIAGISDRACRLDHQRERQWPAMSGFGVADRTKHLLMGNRNPELGGGRGNQLLVGHLAHPLQRRERHDAAPEPLPMTQNGQQRGITHREQHLD
jgi:hypothetical protein